MGVWLTYSSLHLVSTDFRLSGILAVVCCVFDVAAPGFFCTSSTTTPSSGTLSFPEKSEGFLLNPSINCHKNKNGLFQEIMCTLLEKEYKRQKNSNQWRKSHLTLPDPKGAGDTPLPLVQCLSFQWLGFLSTRRHIYRPQTKFRILRDTVNKRAVHILLECILVTRLHSSRMRTARALIISPSMLCAGGVPGLGVCLVWSGGVPGLGGAWSWGGGGGIPPCTEADPPPPWTESQTPVKI